MKNTKVLISDVLIKLKHLRYQQKKHQVLNFSINEYLSYYDMESYDNILQVPEKLCSLAAQLFDVNIDFITFTKTNKVAEHCSRVQFEISNEPKVFYIKNAWEGSIKEAIGIELNNLLTDTPIRYMCSSEIVITESMFDKLTPNLVYQIRDTPEYLHAFGAWEVFTQILHMTDRKTANIMWNGIQLANIDFGLVYYRGKIVFDSRFTIPEKSKERSEGQYYALSLILKNIHNPKVLDMLIGIDTEFCQHLVCHRRPVLPLTSIIKTLESDFIQSIVPQQTQENKSHKYAALSHIGHYKKVNEDSFQTYPDEGLWIVADGLGGYKGGEIASKFVVEQIGKNVIQGNDLLEAISEAHLNLVELSKTPQGKEGMSTTVVAAQIKDNDYKIAWVGDSRAYLFHNNKLKQLTRDHSVIQDLIDNGEITVNQAKIHPDRNKINQALGGKKLDIGVVTGKLKNGILLLCSDGLTGEVSNEKILKILQNQESLQVKAEQLINTLLSLRGFDNTTVLLIQGDNLKSI